MSVCSGELRRRLALLTLVVLLVTPAVLADDINPNQPPEARILPPIGAQSLSEPTEPPEARIKPPVGTQSVTFWIALYARFLPLFW